MLNATGNSPWHSDGPPTSPEWGASFTLAAWVKPVRI
jgi:hypothetical protein